MLEVRGPEMNKYTCTRREQPEASRPPARALKSAEAGPTRLLRTTGGCLRKAGGETRSDVLWSNMNFKLEFKAKSSVKRTPAISTDDKFGARNQA